MSCKDSLLVGWGGATDGVDDNISCPLVVVDDEDSSLELEGCTLQLHPDSTHSLPATLLGGRMSSQVKAVNCKLVGPAPGSSSAEVVGVLTQQHAAATLVGDGVGS
jgi:hypothetical protein